MKPTVGLLLIGALLLTSAFAAEQSRNGYHAPGQAALRGLTLTNDRPEGSLEIPPEILVSSPPVLALSMMEVINPAKTPFQVFVYLSYVPEGAKRDAAPAKILIGNVGLYPPDRPAGFMLRASTAFRKLKSVRKPTHVKLLLEMKRIHPAKPWTHVEVTVAPPEWRDEPERGSVESRSLRDSAARGWAKAKAGSVTPPVWRCGSCISRRP